MNQVAIVTGGSRGIGAATAIKLAKNGYDICLSYRECADEAAVIVAKIEALERKATAIQCDINNEVSIQTLFSEAQKLGNIKVLVNNAGMIGKQARLTEMSAERLNLMFSTNISGTLLCCKHAVSRLSSREGGEGGVIINVSSAASRLGSPNEYIDYAASKGAIDTLTLGLSKELASDEIRVNAVRPGLIYTDIHASSGEAGRVERLKTQVPMQRGGNAEEVAAAIVWLASEEASYITGSLLDVSGGR